MLTDKAADSLFRKSARVGRSSIVTPAFLLSVIYACSVNWQRSGFAIPKISACWAFEPRNSGHLQESLDSNVGAFLRLYYYDRVGVMLTDKAADSLF
ncbi:hypothetical protein CJF27_14820 [Photobacterium iliopiscarium]|nr:hypothetical protein [Photobacterium iliopiscarium]